MPAARLGRKNLSSEDARQGAVSAPARKRQSERANLSLGQAARPAQLLTKPEDQFRRSSPRSLRLATSSSVIPNCRTAKLTAYFHRVQKTNLCALAAAKLLAVADLQVAQATLQDII
jgi:hypothetical protein